MPRFESPFSDGLRPPDIEICLVRIVDVHENASGKANNARINRVNIFSLFYNEVTHKPANKSRRFRP